MLCRLSIPFRMVLVLLATRLLSAVARCSSQCPSRPILFSRVLMVFRIRWPLIRVRMILIYVSRLIPLLLMVLIILRRSLISFVKCRLRICRISLRNLGKRILYCVVPSISRIRLSSLEL